VSGFIWASYELYFKDVINNYRAKRIEQRLIENFNDNEERFTEFIAFMNPIDSIENFELVANDEFKFSATPNSLDSFFQI
jgi:hypothetical protein